MAELKIFWEPSFQVPILFAGLVVVVVVVVVLSARVQLLSIVVNNCPTYVVKLT